jgi:hypothetical protein
MPQKKKMNLALKVALLSTGHTQRRIAARGRISEIRLSEIIHSRGVAVTEAEKERLARVLGVRVEEIFPTVVQLAGK